jgi:hypothetical protein
MLFRPHGAHLDLFQTYKKIFVQILQPENQRRLAQLIILKLKITRVHRVFIICVKLESLHPL